MKKKMLSLLLALVMVLAMLPTAAFAADSDFQIVDGTLKEYYGQGGAVTIPDSVTSIGDSAFKAEKGLTSVTIPDSVTSIGDYAFEDCTGLTSVTVPDSVTSIGSSAFQDCTGLTSVTLPSVNDLGAYCFASCTQLHDIYFGGTMTQWDALMEPLWTWGGVFQGLNSDDGVIHCTDGDAYLDGYPIAGDPDRDFSIHEGKLLEYTGRIGDVVIPDSVTSIAMDAFSGCTDLTSVTIPDSVTSIGDRAFKGCTSLTSLTIPNSVTEIGYDAFYDCTGLTSVTIGSGVTEIWSNAFYNCRGLTSVTIPDSVTSIGNSAFADCTSLTSVTIGSGVTSIGSSAFDGCTSLTSVTLPSGITDIGSSCFHNCRKLSDIYFGGTVSQWEAVQKHMAFLYLLSDQFTIHCTDGDVGGSPVTGGKKVMVSFDSNGGSSVSGKTVTAGQTYGTLPTPTRDGYTFDGWYTASSGGSEVDSYTTVEAASDHTLYAHWSKKDPAQVTVSFDSNGGSSVSDMTVTAGQTYGTLPTPTRDGYTFDGWYTASSGGSEVDSYTTVEAASDHTLYAHWSKKAAGGNFTIENGVLTISGPGPMEDYNRYSDAPWYESWSNITAIVIEQGVTSIGKCAFCQCTPSSVTIPDSVTSIGTAAFFDSGLTSVTIPASVTEIGDMAFWDCISLGDVYYGGSEEQWKATFGDTFEDRSRIFIGNFSSPSLSFHYNSTGPDTPEQPAITFSDVSANDYYAESVAWAVEKGITVGTTKTTFTPKRSCTETEIITFLWRAAGKPVSSAQLPFTVSGKWAFATEALTWAYEKGMIDNRFDENAYCTRYTAVTFIWKAFGSPPSQYEINFKDIQGLDARPIAWAAETEVTHGTTTTSFTPNRVCNRAEIVTFLYRAYNETQQQ